MTTPEERRANIGKRIYNTHRKLMQDQYDMTEVTQPRWADLAGVQREYWKRLGDVVGNYIRKFPET